ncbi:MAG: hypothetical protein AAFY71_23475 [Bacteroidota bacterium]
MEQLDKIIEDLEKLLEDLKRPPFKGFGDFRDWVISSNKIQNTTNITRSGFHELFHELKRAKIAGRTYTKKEWDQYVRIIEAFNLYRGEILEKEKLSERTNTEEFYGYSWLGYFFHSSIHSEAKMGRIRLTVSRSGEVILHNISGGLSPTYIGSFNLIRDSIGIFDLRCSEMPSKRLFFQVTMGPSPRELALGIYLSHWNNTSIMSGTIVLELITDTTKNIDSKLLSYRHESEEFFAVDPAIRRYLSRKNLNQIKLPNAVYSKKDLRAMLTKYRTNKRSLFFNEDKPTLFLSTPTNSISEERFQKNKESIDFILSAIQETIPDLKIIFGGKRRTVIEKTSFLDKMEHMKRTQFFVLIHDSPEAKSASIMELAWALIFCKVVIVFYKEGAIPELLPHLHNSRRLNYFTAIPINSLNQEKEKIKDKMIIELLHQLRGEYEDLEGEQNWFFPNGSFS